MHTATRTFVLTILAVAHSAAAQGTSIRTRHIATMTAPTFVVAVPGDPSRLLVGTYLGYIYNVRLPAGTVDAAPFLRITNTSVNGMLNLVFDRDYIHNGYFYFSYQGTTTPNIHHMRGRISTTNPDIADPATFTTVLNTYHTGGQHTGTLIGFGPDGYLYISSGDQSGDPQLLSTWGGKVFRIDPDGPDNIPGTADDDQFPTDPNRNYCIPTDNPYVSMPNALPEIWARGLRNPYRCSFDPETGNLWIGDVGENQREEIDVMPPNSPSMNFGWNIIEGTRCNTTAAACAALVSTPPVYEYPHSGPALLTGNAVIGGAVYRGCAIPQMYGSYLFADHGNSWVASFRYESGQRVGLSPRACGLAPSSATQYISCIAPDLNGELYACRVDGNELIKFEPTVSHDCDGNGAPDSCQSLPTCRADFNGDCGVTIDDLLAYLTAYAAGALSADEDDGGGTGLIDGAVTIDDLLYFLARFAAGC